MSSSKRGDEPPTESLTPAPRKAKPAGAADLLALQAAVLARRDKTLRELRAGYPAAGAAEQLLLRLASADSACLEELAECESALTGLLKDRLFREPAGAEGAVRLLREFGRTAAVLRSRVQMSLTAATTIMATSRLVGAQPPKAAK
jgi:hypothetical protein